MKTKHQNKNGYLLVELVIGLAVLTASLTVLFRVWPNVARSDMVSRERMQAVLAAQAELETLKAVPAGLKPGRRSFGPDADRPFWRKAPPPTLLRPEYTVEVGRNGRLRTLTVTVAWGSARGQRVVLSTIVRTP